MILQNNVVQFLSTNTYLLIVKGTAEIYFKTIEMNEFVLDSTLTDTTGSFVAKDGLQIKAVYTLPAEVILL
jgi:hypothetical protein